MHACMHACTGTITCTASSLSVKKLFAIPSQYHSAILLVHVFALFYVQVVTLLAVQLGFTDDVSPDSMTTFTSKAYSFVQAAAPQVCSAMFAVCFYVALKRGGPYMWDKVSSIKYLKF